MHCQLHPMLQRKKQIQSYPLQMREILDKPFDKIAIDLVMEWKTCNSGNKYILTIIDHLMGWPEAFPKPNKSVKTIESTFINQYVLCELTIPKQDQIKKRIKYRNINGIDIDDFANNLVFRECDSDDLEAVVANFEEVVSKAMNTHAPFIERDVTIRRK